MNFDHPQHSLEGSRLNSCTCIVMLVVMVASSHWNYLNFIYLFILKRSMFLMVWAKLCMLGGGPRCRDPPKGPQIAAVG
jgi:hypothetical protein